MEETKWLTFTVLQMWVGKEKADQALAKLREWLDDDTRRFDQGTPVYAVTDAYERRMDAGLFTLEEIAAKPRVEVVAVKGVGPVTMRRLEAAMAERGLAFAEGRA